MNGLGTRPLPRNTDLYLPSYESSSPSILFANLANILAIKQVVSPVPLQPSRNVDVVSWQDGMTILTAKGSEDMSSATT